MSNASAFGKLLLIPVPLGEGGLGAIPPEAIAAVHHLEVFIVEKAKTARHFIKATQAPKPLPELTLHELHEPLSEADLLAMLQPALQGQDIGLMSEAGCPGIADPGAAVVRVAHRLGIEVVPLAGPSSIVLALMASGMNGQSFCFHGYLPAKRPELERALQRLEQQALRTHQTQIFIETPYRNGQVIEAALKVLAHSTYFGVACNLSLPGQYVRSRPTAEWRQLPPPDLHKQPAVFLIGSPILPQ